jgi:hypothetical protein
MGLSGTPNAIARLRTRTLRANFLQEQLPKLLQLGEFMPPIHHEKSPSLTIRFGESVLDPHGSILNTALGQVDVLLNDL